VPSSPAPAVAASAPSDAPRDPCTSAPARSPRANRCAPVPTAAGTFPPQRPLLRRDGPGYSPAVRQLIVEAAGGLDSFADAAFALHLAGLEVSPRHVGRLAHEIGGELARGRDGKAVRRRRRQVPARVAAPPAVAAVAVDGGRLRTRAAASGPGVHQPPSKEDKIACLVSLESVPHAQGPPPEPPPPFLEPRRVQRLVRQIKGLPGDHPAEAAEPAAAPPPAEKKAPPVAESPKRLVRACVASMHDSRSFGPLAAAEAQERDFYRAPRRAFLGAGQAYNWSIQKGYFPDFEPLADVLHVLCYLYLASWATGGEAAQRWSLSLAWLRACWPGRVGAVLEELRVWQGQRGKPPPGAELPEYEPRRLVAAALRELGNNQRRLDYPRYRREGLPVTSSLVESRVGEFNDRVKGPQRFWNRGEEGAETSLQVRAAVLSEDDRLRRHFAARPGSPYRRKAG